MIYVKKLALALCLLIAVIGLMGCGNNQADSNGGDEDGSKSEQFVEASVNEDGDIVVEEDSISEDATFITYRVDDVNMQFIAVRASDGTVRLAFNTCQSCNPAPKAYFVQKGNNFICQNCGTSFSTDQIGVERGGCNPAIIEEKTEENGTIIIAKDYVEYYKENFASWQGPTE